MAEKRFAAPAPNIVDYSQPQNVPMTTPEEEACRVVRQEKSAWENSIVYVTPQVAFNLPVLIRTLLKNYYGIFDQPTDTQTGQDKIWVPLTETLTETVVKNIDLSTKDIEFHALNPEAVGYTKIVRSAVRAHLNKIFFGEKLKEALRHLSIWGTVVWSTEEVKKQIDLRIVNLLNFYIEPTSPSIAEADKVTERFPLTVSEFRTMAARNKWKNWEDVTGRKTVPRYDSWLQLQNYPSDTLFVEVYRLRGMVPKFIFTGNDDDRMEQVAGELTVSWDNGTWRFHDAELRKDNKNKGYEEAWFTRVPQRWMGRGIAEKALPMQVYANAVINIRRTRAQVAQLGLFKVKRGSGITTQSLQRLAVNGAVMVNNMDDVQQFVVEEMGQTNYTDEQVIWNWAQRVTQAQEISAGDELPASTPATNAQIQSTSAQGAYVLIKENTGLFLERWLRNQALPIIMKNLTVGQMIRFTGDPDEIRELDEHIVLKLLCEEIDKATEQNKAVDPQQIQLELQRALLKLQKSGTARFIKLEDMLNPLDYDVEVNIANEKIDEGIMTQRLVQMLQLAPEDKDQIMPALFDLLGLPYKPPTLGGVPQGAPPQQGQPQGAPQGNPGQLNSPQPPTFQGANPLQAQQQGQAIPTGQ